MIFADGGYDYLALGTGEIPEQRRERSDESGFQTGERVGDFVRVAQAELRVRGTAAADEDRDTLPGGGEGGLVGKVIAKINRQGVAKLSGQGLAQSRAFVGHAKGSDF